MYFFMCEKFCFVLKSAANILLAQKYLLAEFFVWQIKIYSGEYIVTSLSQQL